MCDACLRFCCLSNGRMKAIYTPNLEIKICWRVFPFIGLLGLLTHFHVCVCVCFLPRMRFVLLFGRQSASFVIHVESQSQTFDANQIRWVFSCKFSPFAAYRIDLAIKESHATNIDSLLFRMTPRHIKRIFEYVKIKIK